MTALLGGLFGVFALVAFVSAIRISYRIEARSNPERFGGRRMGYTNIWAVALNMGVAKDEETQSMRRKLLTRLAIVAVLFACMALVATVNR